MGIQDDFKKKQKKNNTTKSVGIIWKKDYIVVMMCCYVVRSEFYDSPWLQAGKRSEIFDILTFCVISIMCVRSWGAQIVRVIFFFFTNAARHAPAACCQLITPPTPSHTHTLSLWHTHTHHLSHTLSLYKKKAAFENVLLLDCNLEVTQGREQWYRISSVSFHYMEATV